MADSTSLFEENIHSWAEVILPLALPMNYTYAIPQHFEEKVKRGVRVEVVLGKNKKYAGIVWKIHREKPEFETKEILNVVDLEPVVFEHQLRFWEWMAAYYMCGMGDVMAAALPAHLKLSSEAVLIYNDDFQGSYADLNDEEYLLAEAIEVKKELKITEAQQVTGLHNVYPVIQNLLEKKVCFVWEALANRYREKMENFVFLNPEFAPEDKLRDLMDQLEKAPRQLELLLGYLHFAKTAGEVLQSELLKKTGATHAQLKGLEAKKVLMTERRSVDRLQLLPRKVDITFELNPHQQKALGEIGEIFREKNVCLLHGVTSSGKTLLYMKQMEEFVKAGRQVLYLLPEITLTAQLIRRLQLHFGGNIAVYHSKFNDNERVEIWNKTKSGEVNIVLGARSALFLPFKDLALIIVDEEHDTSFKQHDPSPRYHARDAAIYYGRMCGAKILLGSATPSLESYYNAQKGKYGLVSLLHRFGEVPMPRIEIIDTKTAAAWKKGKVMLTPQLKAAVEETVRSDKQVILFQNRRGYVPFLICNTCNYTARCKNCAVTLTYHKSSNKLHCHYCGETYSRLVNCPACGSVNWKEKDFGTERVEEDLVEAFPDFKVARMDVDAVRGKNAHDNLIKLFEQQRIDILAGTQMVVKGLDFEKVSLVGILDADGLLNFSDFRANERGFQLMEQVSGRAGRKDGNGTVMIQAAQTNHHILRLVQEHDYHTFFKMEMEERRRYYYPPFCRLISLTLKHVERQVVWDAGQFLADLLHVEFKEVAGPAEPVVNRVRNRYLIEIMIKLVPDAQALMQQKRRLNQFMDQMRAEKRFRSVFVSANVDPM